MSPPPLPAALAESTATTPAGEPIIAVRNLHRTFGNVQAVRGVSFDIYPGQVVGFIGANGAGKTTTMRVMATLDLPTFGAVRIAGYDVVNHPTEVREKIGWMPDSYGVYSHVTVFEYLDFYGRSFGFKQAERARRVAEVMEFTDLTPIADRMINKLSKGMGQRLCLGRTLLHDPEVLILDEPAAGLDPKARIEFKQLVRLLAGEGKTIFISSHILSELGEMCDTLLFIDGGRIVHHGSAESLQRHGGAGIVIDVHVTGDPEVLTTWVSLNPNVTMLEAHKRGGRLSFTMDDPEALAANLKRMVADGVPLIEFHRESRKLEDAFVDMLKKGVIEENANVAAIPLSDNPVSPRPVTVLQTTSDFADWLSPMLVKELRQGMRTRLFVGSFILLQISMTLNVIVGLLVAADQRDPGFSTGIFWGIVAIPVLFILPLSGLGAVSNEMSANTLELVFLTRLSAWRIIAGKWFALVAQTVLLICAVLPYAVLRYFVGGVNVTEELITLAVMLAVSAVLCSVTVGLSPYQTRLTRALLAIGLVFFAWAIVPALFMARFSTFGFSAAAFSWGLGIALVVCALLFLFLMLEIGASKIAPPAENHSAKKRGFTFAFFLLALLFSVVLHDSKLITSLAWILAVCVCTDALCEQPRWIPSLFRPFARRGLAGRLLGRFAYPGWPSGVAFTIVTLGVFAALMVKQEMLDNERAYLTYISLCGALLLPAALIRLLFPRSEKALAFFIGFQAISLALTLLAVVVDENDLFKFSMRKAVSILPTSTLMMTSGSLPDESERFFITVTSVITGLSMLALLFLIPAAWKRMRQLEDESLQAPVPHAAVA